VRLTLCQWRSLVGLVHRLLAVVAVDYSLERRPRPQRIDGASADALQAWRLT
jgi:hypothetical protein